MNQHAHTKKQFVSLLRRLLSGLLCAVMLCGMLPTGFSLAGSAGAAEIELAWSDEDLDILRGYDIMRGYEDGEMHPERTIRRSEFAAMVNRALGYKEKAAKFNYKDVTTSDWFYDDMSISYNMGYLNGMSSTTMDPKYTLTREQALVILCRNLMLQPTVGESINYADSRSFGSWSRGYIDPAIEAGLIDADRTGNFMPSKAITRGEVAGMIVRAIGTPVKNTGVTSLGTVDGNVTITTSNVTLRNTVIHGDLYLSGGIGLGDVLLDNVTVSGKIVDSGAGLSEKGGISVILNNVTADELIVDSMRNQTISLAAKGGTSIPKTSLRTSAYVDDSTPAGYGLDLIEIDGEEKTAVRLSGNIKEVHNKTRNSSLSIGEGVAKKVTVDEAATGSTVDVSKDARIETLNLDAGVKVSGSGYVDSVTISANGATVAQLPDEIVVAPGITASVNKVKMDTAAAQEASSRPKLMPGYPSPTDLTPNSATVIFKTNKPGTVYWALTAMADGSPDEEDVISTPSYSKKIIKAGSIKVKESNKEYTVKITGLTSDASYYLSAIVLDDRDSRSTMKVAAFTTPDNSTPAFSKGYPEMKPEHITEKDAQVSVMTTKSCQLYYAVLPKGSTAPRAIDFKTGSISGSLGSGTVKMAKDSPAYISVNDVDLEEKQSYVLYLWLNDFDGAKSSAVKSINFTTADRTDPIVSNLRQTKSTAASVIAAYTLNEPGTLYWAAIKAGDKSYETPAPGYTNDTWLVSRSAMERIIAGTGALKSGKSSVAASKVGADVSFTVSGLNSKTTGTSSYDLYYVAVDSAGNWSKPVRHVTINTDDTTDPTVVQRFTSYNEDDKAEEATTEPLADTSVKLIFSKQMGASDVGPGGTGAFRAFMELYQGTQADKDTLARLLSYYIKLYEVPSTGTVDKLVPERTAATPEDADWVIDYRNVTLYLDGTDMVLEFPNERALNLANGRTYYFSFWTGDTEVVIKDTTTRNIPLPARYRTLPKFKTKQAQIIITDPVPSVSEIILEDGTSLSADFTFELTPRTTERSPDNIFYDIMLWCDATLTCDLYKLDETTKKWSRVTENSSTISGREVGAFSYSPAKGQEQYQTIMGAKLSVKDLPFADYSEMELKEFPKPSVKYAVHVVTADGSWRREKWDLTNNTFRVTIAAANAQGQGLLRSNNGKTGWEELQKEHYASCISNDFTGKIPVSREAPPELVGLSPTFTMLDTTAAMTIQLDAGDSATQKCMIYYIVSKLDETGGTLTDTNVTVRFADETKTLKDAPENGSDIKVEDEVRQEFILTNPAAGTVKDPKGNTDIIYGSINHPTVGVGVNIPLTGLAPNTWYGVYMVFERGFKTSQTVCYKFKTQPPITPVLMLNPAAATKDASLPVNAVLKWTSATVDVGLMTKTFADDSVLGQPIYSAAELDESKLQTYGITKETTVLDTLVTVIGGNDKTADTTVFDKITLSEDAAAGTVLRTAVRTLISNCNIGQQLNQKMTVNPLSEDLTSEQLMKFNPPENTENSYICLAMATNNADPNDIKTAFCARQGLIVVDLVKPEIDEVVFNLTLKPDKEGEKEVWKVVGEIEVTYSKGLYMRDGSGIVRPFTTYTPAEDATEAVKNAFKGYAQVPPEFEGKIATYTNNAPDIAQTVTIKVDQIVEYRAADDRPKTATISIRLPRFCNRYGVDGNASATINYKEGGNPQFTLQKR